MNLDWSQEDRFLSNYGKGPLTARILCATDKTVRMERWRGKGRYRSTVQFELPLKFFLSPACGWVRADNAS